MISSPTGNRFRASDEGDDDAAAPDAAAAPA